MTTMLFWGFLVRYHYSIMGPKTLFILTIIKAPILTSEILNLSGLLCRGCTRSLLRPGAHPAGTLPGSSGAEDSFEGFFFGVPFWGSFEGSSRGSCKGSFFFLVPLRPS